ncbi:MAG: TRC40/GET3/ArsA family transport-energizing ATPase [Alcaligenaceae bacterium]|nr:TRC40/GET3/ArsA family transport-energizing ATPase [Alcaligenaceae bacterium]
MFKKIIFIGGKGGVGKSSCASALALTLSAQKRVLLVSTDPAHNLGDIFDQPFGHDIKTVQPNLDILEVDGEYQAKRLVQEAADRTKDFVSTMNYEQVDSYYKQVADAKSTQENALFEYLCEVVTFDYDHIVVDTAPSGHTLRLLALPKQLASWSRKLLKIQQNSENMENILGHLPADKTKNPDAFFRQQMIQILDQRYQKYSRFEAILRTQSTFFFVMNAAKLSLNETIRGQEEMKDIGLTLDGIILNKLLPETSNDPFLQSRIDEQNIYVPKAEEHFKKQHIIKLPLLPQDLTNITSLEQLGDTIYREFET